jgi:FkbM family methyltransferase
MDEQVVALGSAELKVGVPTDERLGSFWTQFATGGFEPGTRRIVEEHAGPGRTFVDVGAWIGPFTLLAASLGAHVVAYEPDPLAVAELRANLARNPTLPGPVEVHEVALASSTGMAVLVADDGLGNGRSTVAAGPEATAHPAGGGSPAADRTSVHTVDARSEAATDAWRGCNLLKIDVEGGEYAAVPRLRHHLRQQRPALLLSLHGPDPAPILATRFGRWKLVRYRLSGATRRVPLLWSVQWYPQRFRAADNRTDDWRPISRMSLLLLALRMGETELYLHA